MDTQKQIMMPRSHFWLWLAAVALWTYILTGCDSQTVPIVVPLTIEIEVPKPKYKTKQCFNTRQSYLMPYGMIAYIQEPYYVVLPHTEADRRSAGHKLGLYVPIRQLDAITYLVSCPRTWARSTSRD